MLCCAGSTALASPMLCCLYAAPYCAVLNCGTVDIPLVIKFMMTEGKDASHCCRNLHDGHLRKGEHLRGNILRVGGSEFR